MPFPASQIDKLLPPFFHWKRSESIYIMLFLSSYWCLPPYFSQSLNTNCPLSLSILSVYVGSHFWQPWPLLSPFFLLLLVDQQLRYIGVYTGASFNYAGKKETSLWLTHWQLLKCSLRVSKIKSKISLSLTHWNPKSLECSWFRFLLIFFCVHNRNYANCSLCS